MIWRAVIGLYLLKLLSRAIPSSLTKHANLSFKRFYKNGIKKLQSKYSTAWILATKANGSTKNKILILIWLNLDMTNIRLMLTFLDFPEKKNPVCDTFSYREVIENKLIKQHTKIKIDMQRVNWIILKWENIYLPTKRKKKKKWKSILKMGNLSWTFYYSSNFMLID